MKRLLLMLAGLASSRAASPLVLFCFLLLYIGIAFFSPEPLTTLIKLTASTPLAILFAVIPLNCAVRLLLELRCYTARRAALTGRSKGAHPAELFDECCEIPAVASIDKLEARLHSAGYHTSLTKGSLAAWRGITLSPARMFLFAALSMLFAGILLSTSFRSSQRETLIEGEPFPQAAGGGETVKNIVLMDYPGIFLNKTVAIELESGGGSRKFGLYPPSLYNGRFVYPRYLGIAPLIRFVAPDLPDGFESFLLLSIYPPGKEDSATIPGSPYRIVFSMAASEPGDEPFRSGRMILFFRAMKGDRPVFSGNIPIGDSLEKDGYRISFSESRRLVIVDLVRDYGFFFIWASAFTGLCAVLFWLPVRMFFPRRELLFVVVNGTTAAYSRAEGGSIGHGGVFHDAIDFLDEGSSDRLGT